MDADNTCDVQHTTVAHFNGIAVEDIAELQLLLTMPTDKAKKAFANICCH